MKLANNPFVFLFRNVWKYSVGNRPSLILSMCMSVIARCSDLINPLIIAWLLNIIQRDGISMDNIYKLVGIAALLVVSNIGFWCFHGPARYLERRNAFLMRKNYQEHMINGVLALPLAWHTEHHSGNTIDKISKGSNAIFEFADELFLPLHLLIGFLSAYIALSIFNIHATYIVLVAVVFAVFTIVKMDKKLKTQYDTFFSMENDITAKIFDSISNITTVVILGLQKLVSKDIIKTIIKPFAIFKKSAAYNEFKWFVVSVYASSLTVLILGSYLISAVVSGKVILIGTIYVLYAYVEQINSQFFNLANLYSTVVWRKSMVENAEKLSKDFVEEEDIMQHELTKWNKITINDLSFSYFAKQGTLNLYKMSLDIKRGDKIALVGESGSGKTTFMKLLKGLYEPVSAEVRVDGILLKDKFKTIKDNTTLIPQEPELFATTVRRNITMGLSYSQSELDRYVKLACFDKVVARLPKKYESSVVEKGVNLSGGEKQRLALARGLLAAKDREIILMDEPTSSVDSVNELVIFENIFTKFKSKTILASVHRLHMLRLFDRILLFDKGELVATGTLEELLKNNKYFQRIWKKYSQRRKAE